MIGLPLGKERWWEHVIDEDGQPVRVLTFEDLKEIWSPEIDAVIDRMAQQIRDTLDEIIKQGGYSESLHKRKR